MEPTIADFLRGSPSDDPVDYVHWLYGVHQSLSNAPEKEIRDVAVPIKKAADTLSKVLKGTDEEQKAAQTAVGLHLMQAQGMAVYFYLSQLKKMRDTIRVETDKLSKSSALRPSYEKLFGAYDKAVMALGTAYNGLREGKLDALKNLSAELDQVQATIEELRK